MKSSRCLLLHLVLCLLPASVWAAVEPALARLELDCGQVHANEGIRTTWTCRSIGSATGDLLGFAHPGRPDEGGAKALDHITLSIDKKVLNPVRERRVAGKLTVTAFYLDGSKRVLRTSEAMITARTRNASGN